LLRWLQQNRQQSHVEEMANSISHGIGLIAAFTGTPVLIIDAIHNENRQFIVGSSLF